MTIDHKETTIDLLESITLDTEAIYGQNYEDQQLRISLAQVHATMYLAEQQKILNMIIADSILPLLQNAMRELRLV
jgi:hypothetical protein